MKKPISFATSIFLAGAIAGGVALAHEGASGIVKERMDMMKSMADAMKGLAPMMKGEAAFDGARVRQLASEIDAGAATIKTSFPEGSMGHPSEATARIWSEPAGFEASAQELRDYAAALQGSADEGRDAARAIFNKMAGTCKDCHQDYREKQQ